MRIAYGTVTLPLGVFGVGVSDKGICFVGSGRQIAANIRSYYPDAEVVHDQQAVAAAADALKQWAAGKEVRADINARGTAFQMRVWDAMRRIPRGQTRTYTQIARTIGKPEAARAVGTACGANPVALLIPCHRVVGKVGLGGYAWGLPLKKQLLKLEGACE